MNHTFEGSTEDKTRARLDAGSVSRVATCRPMPRAPERTQDRYGPEGSQGPNSGPNRPPTFGMSTPTPDHSGHIKPRQWCDPQVGEDGAPPACPSAGEPPHRHGPSLEQSPSLVTILPAAHAPGGPHNRDSRQESQCRAPPVNPRNADNEGVVKFEIGSSDEIDSSDGFFSNDPSQVGVQSDRSDGSASEAPNPEELATLENDEDPGSSTRPDTYGPLTMPVSAALLIRQLVGDLVAQMKHNPTRHEPRIVRGVTHMLTLAPYEKMLRCPLSIPRMRNWCEWTDGETWSA